MFYLFYMHEKNSKCDFANVINWNVIAFGKLARFKFNQESSYGFRKSNSIKFAFTISTNFILNFTRSSINSAYFQVDSLLSVKTQSISRSVSGFPYQSQQENGRFQPLESITLSRT